MIPGDQEFVEGVEFYNRLKTKLSDNFLISNSRENELKIYQKSFADARINIRGILSPESFEFIKLTSNLSLSTEVNNIIKPTKKDELNIVIYHGTSDSAQSFAAKNQSVDLILLGHDQRKGVWENNNCTIVGNGKDSEYISVIQIEKKSDWNFNVKQIEISEQIPEDKEILKIIERFYEDIAGM
jgi:2',3'-cyclic-nucleotide 2'-phosphodiesterase (5'-nucleotidase family)